MKPGLKLGSIVATLALLAACSSGIQQPNLELGDETPELSTQGTSVSNTVSNSESDAEQVGSNTYTTSTVLELGYKVDGTPQTTGVRFLGVAVPKGARVTGAYLQFTAVTDKSEATNLSIAGQDVASGGPFSSTTNNITSRTKTSARSSWQPGVWVDGQRYNSSSIGSIVQEIVNRSDWQSGAAMVFIISGTGTRKAVSYDQSSTLAPKLYVTYEAALSDKFKASPSMTVKPDFSLAALQAYDKQHGTEAATWYQRLVNSREFSSAYNADLRALFEGGNSQGPLRVVSRDLNLDISTILLAFRMTGSRVLLDRVRELMALALEYQDRTSAGYYYWTDTYWPNSELEITLSHGMVAQVAYAFYLNRNIDPAYASMYNTLKNYLRNSFEKIYEGSGGYNGGSIIEKNLFHAYTNWTRYYWYMYLMLKNSSNSAEASDAPLYLGEAQRKGEAILDVMKTYTGNNTFVVPHRVWAEEWGPSTERCNPEGGYICQYHPGSSYPNETATGFNALIMDGFTPFANRTFAEKLSRSYRLNFINGNAFNGDRNDKVMSSDMGPNQSSPCSQYTSDPCEGITLRFQTTDPHDNNKSITLTYVGAGGSRGEARHFTERNMSHSGFWDTTGEIMSKAATYYNGTGSTAHFVPSALVAYELYKAGNYTLP